MSTKNTNSQINQNIIDEALKLETQKCVDRLSKVILLNPIAKCFLQKYQPHHDIIHTFEDAMSHIEDIVSKESISYHKTLVTLLGNSL